ncbi:glycosyltransferase family 4 protein [Candidatus Fermentibacterales bacterium]|nr:glycosyltransferase family 4 protein [Candidatus Fermentibacterales bacterium]
MRILVLNWRDIRNPDMGGAEVHLHEIMKRVASAGHDVLQVSHSVKGLPDSETIDGIRIVRRGGRLTFNLGLRRFCERLDGSFDLIIEDLCKLPFYSPRWGMAPVMVVVPHLFGTTAYREVSLPLALYVNALEKLIPSVYAGSPFVAISQSTKADLVRRGIQQDSISVVECGIDTAHYHPVAGVTAAPGTMLYVGRLKRYKGIQYILKALSALARRGHDYRLVLQGTGDYEGPLRRMAAGLEGLEGRVDFQGRVSEVRKLEWLTRAWVAVFPSEKEGWGLTVIEANACGTSVVASNSDGLRDSVRHGETGYLVPQAAAWAGLSESGRCEELERTLETVLSDPEHHSRMKPACLQWARRFSWDETGRRMLALIEKAAAG